MVEVNPGKVTWMLGDFGDERFDYAFRSSGTAPRPLQGYLIEGVVREGTRELVPGIASKWEVSSDGRTWTVTIREGVKFHDGTEVTAEDVTWTLQQVIGPQAPEYGRGTSISVGKNMDRIEQAGPDQVDVTFKVPDGSFPILVSAMTVQWIGVMPKRAKLGDEEESLAYERNPIGAGMMRLVEHVSNDSMTFERFADYYYQPQNGFPIDQRPNFSLLDERLIPEEATRVAALRAGEADIAPVSLAQKKQVEAGGGRIVFGQEGAFIRIRLFGCWNDPERPLPCDDKRVRLALQYAIDKELIRDQLYGGPEVFQIKGHDTFTPNAIGYSPELDPRPFDPDKARQLLADAGYPGGKGFGKLVVHTWLSNVVPLLPESALLGTEFWRRELGLDVEVRVSERAVFNKYQYTDDVLGEIQWGQGTVRVDPSSYMRGRWGTPSSNKMPHQDPELFALVARTLSVVDPVEKEKIFNSTARRMRDEAYDINLGYLNIPWGVGPRILTWEPYPMADYPSAFHTITLK